MPYTIIIPDNVQKSMNKLPADVKERIVRKIYSIGDDPFRHIIPVKDTDFYRLRSGSFRVIMKVERGRLIIVVLKVDKRSRIYDSL